MRYIISIIVVVSVGFNLLADNIYVGESNLGRVAKYSATGSLIKASFITGLASPRDIKVTTDGRILVADAGSSIPSFLALYSTTGAVLNPSLTAQSGVNFFWSALLQGTNVVTIQQNTATSPSFVLQGTNLVSTNSGFLSTYTKYNGCVVTDGSYYYVNDTLLNHIQKFNLNGSVATYSLAITPYSVDTMAVDGTNLYVTFYSQNAVGKYSTSGLQISTNLISGLNGPVSIAADGRGHIFIANYNSGTVGEYTTEGATINPTLITNLNGPWGLAVEKTAPSLNIIHSNSAVIVSWLNQTNFNLQTNGVVSGGGWSYSGNGTNTNGTNVATFPNPGNRLFFRLLSTNGI